MNVQEALELFHELHNKFPGYGFELSVFVGANAWIRLIVYQRGGQNHYSTEFTLAEIECLRGKMRDHMWAKAIMAMDYLENGREQNVH